MLRGNEAEREAFENAKSESSAPGVNAEDLEVPLTWGSA